MSKKALFFDIDGTLLSEVTRAIPDSTLAALDQAHQAGHLIFINTGRSYSQLQPIKAVMKADGWLCGCGTYIEAEGEVLYHRLIPEDQAKAIVDAIIKYNLEGVLEGREGCFYSHQTSRFEVGQALLTMIGFSMRPDGGGEPLPFEKFCVIADDQSDKAAFFRSLGLGIDVTNRGDGFYECVPVGHTKATAIETVLKHYQLDLADAYVFGDSVNDLSMFEYVPNAILMGKHDKELEPYASFLTKTVEQDGIAYAMERLGLLE